MTNKFVYIRPDGLMGEKYIETVGTHAVFSINYKRITNRWLENGNIPSNLNGFDIDNNGILNKIIIQAKTISSGIIHFSKNNSLDIFHSIELVNEKYKKVDGLNIELQENDILGVYVTSPSGIDYPKVRMEVLWR